jgi:hypothetical protein
MSHGWCRSTAAALLCTSADTHDDERDPKAHGEHGTVPEGKPAEQQIQERDTSELTTTSCLQQLSLTTHGW